MKRQLRGADETSFTQRVVEQELIIQETRALERWLNGDPSGFLEICADDVVYFDPYTPRRLNGLVELTPYYEALRGKIFAERFELFDPKVQTAGGVAVLTFNFVSYGGNENSLHWNCTEVYRRSVERWQIIQTHWSFTRVAS